MKWGLPGQFAMHGNRGSAVRAALGCALAGLIWAAPASAETVAGGGTGNAVVVEPLALIKVQDLDFGKIVPRPTAGTVTVNPDTGACSVTGTILQVGTCKFAQFTGMGRRNNRVRFQLPTTITLTAPGGATMTADTLTLGTSPDLTFAGGNGNGLGNGNRRWTINQASGIFSFRIGARLNVGANQAPGLYVGTFNVTVQYN
jgi:Domain of unknown function (DUF4402)